jgi:putative membrane protein
MSLVEISPECRDNNYKNAQETDGMTEYEQRQIAEAIARVERRTDAELVTVLARRADDYAYWPLLWAAVLALVIPLLLHWLAGRDRRATACWWRRCSPFVALCLLLRHPRLAAWLMPAILRRWRASGLARQQFLELNLQRTAGATGVLIFVSEAERHVEILVDEGIARHLPPRPARPSLPALPSRCARAGPCRALSTASRRAASCSASTCRQPMRATSCPTAW